MGLFSKNEAEKKKEKEVENAHKYTEILTAAKKEDLEIEIAKRIEAGRIIQKIDYECTLGRKRKRIRVRKIVL